MVVELLKDNFPKKLENEQQVRDRAIVFQVMAGQGCSSSEGDER